MTSYQIPQNNGFLPNRKSQSVGIANTSPYNTGICKRVASKYPNFPFSISLETTDWHALFQTSNNLHKLITVYLKNGDSLVNENLNIATEVLYSTQDLSSISNEISIVVPIPAQKRSISQIGRIAVTFTNTRSYTKSEREASYIIPAQAIDHISRVLNMAKKDKLSNLEHNKSEDQFKEPANLLPIIESAIADKQGLCSHSLKTGVSLSIRESLNEHSMNYAVCQTAELFATSMGDSIRSIIDKRPSERLISMRRNLVAQTIKNIVENTFGLHKNPVKFMEKFLSIGLINLQNISKQNNFSENSYIYPDLGNSKIKIEGVICIPQNMVTSIPNIFSGRREGHLPIGKLNDSRFTKDPGSGSLLILSRQDEDAFEKTIRNSRSLQANSIINQIVSSDEKTQQIGYNLLSEAAVNLFRNLEQNDDNFEEDGAVSWLYDLNINRRVNYITRNSLEHGETAIVLDIIQPQYQADMALRQENLNKSATGISIRNEIMHVSLGDMQLDDTIIEWFNSLVKDCKNTNPKFQHSARRMFGRKSVTEFNPAICATSHIFGDEEFLAAISCPYLFEKTLLERCVNNELDSARDVSKSTDSTIFKNIYKNVYQTRLKYCKMKTKLIPSYYMSRESVSKTRRMLLATEYSPFYEVICETKNDNDRFTFLNRYVFGQFPDYVVDKKVHLLRGNMLANMYDVKKIETRVDSPTTEEDLVKIRDTLLEMLRKIYGTSTELSTTYLLHDHEKLLKLVKFWNESKEIKSGEIKINDPYDDSVWYKDICDMFTNTKIELSDQDKIIPLYILSRNILSILTDNTIHSIHKLLSIVMMFVRNTPTALSQTVINGISIGLAVDFFRSVDILSNDMLLSTPNSMSIIVTPHHPYLEKCSDNSRLVKLRATIQSATNNLTTAGILAPSAVPNPKCSDLATMGDNCKPRISMDYMTAINSNGTLKEHVYQLIEDVTERETILANLSNYDESRTKMFKMKKNNSFDHGYISILRPMTNISADPIPYLGKSRMEAVPIHDNFSPAQAFHSFYDVSEENYENNISTHNPWISNINSLYNSMYRRNNSLIVDERDNTLHFTTMNNRNMNNGDNDPVCHMTNIFENALDFMNIKTLCLFPEMDNKGFENIIQTKRFGLDNNVVQLDTTPSNSSKNLSSFEKLYLTALYGYSVANTAFTNKNLLGVDKSKLPHGGVVLKSGDCPSDYAILSGYRSNIIE